MLRLLDVGWRTFQRYPLLPGGAAEEADAEADHDRHLAVFDHLDRLLVRGKASKCWPRAFCGSVASTRL
jgi:hypothetical protein